MDFPHRRYNALTGDWVLVSPHRTKRPWQGKVEKPSLNVLPKHDENCFLCAGNTRSSGEVNPNYDSTFAFTNDFSAIIPEIPMMPASTNELLQAKPVKGTCRVLCFSPRHDLSLSQMGYEEILNVVDLWIEQMKDLGETYKWVQLFENRGAIMGSSIPHPHGQLWASDQLPNEIIKEDHQQRNYYLKNKKNLLQEYLDVEEENGERVVVANDDWVVLVPYWAVWPFETLLLPKKPIQYMQDISDNQRLNLAMILEKLLTKYDNLFETQFPYSMGWHPAPYGSEDYSHWQLHAHFYPPLLRSSSVKKFLVGYEMLAEAQRDITAEQAAQRLRDLSDIHYLKK